MKLTTLMLSGILTILPISFSNSKLSLADYCTTLAKVSADITEARDKNISIEDTKQSARLAFSKDQDDLYIILVMIDSIYKSPDLNLNTIRQTVYNSCIQSQKEI